MKVCKPAEENYDQQYLVITWDKSLQTWNPKLDLSRLYALCE